MKIEWDSQTEQKKRGRERQRDWGGERVKLPERERWGERERDIEGDRVRWPDRVRERECSKKWDRMREGG